MKIYKQLVTKSNLPEYHLDHTCDYGSLKQELFDLGYGKSDFSIICHSGYDMKEVIRLIKSKIRKDSEALEIIKGYLLTEETFINLKDTLYYPMIKRIPPQSI